jgi:hypothetical protein
MVEVAHAVTTVQRFLGEIVQMSELGPSIKQAMEFLQKIHKDISKLISAVDEGMSEAGFESLIGNACIGAGSKSSQWPLSWMPRTFYRVYGQSLSPTDQEHGQVVVFFQVFMVPKLVSQPIALWGLAVQKSSDEVFTRLNPYFNSHEGPEFLDRERETSWRGVLNTGFDLFEVRSCPLVELKDQAAVEETILNQLLERLQSIRKPPGQPA